MLFAFDGDRRATVGALLSYISRSGIRTIPSSSWDTCDARLLPSFMLGASVTSSAYPVHWLQLRVRRFIRLKRACFYLAGVAFVLRDRALALSALLVTLLLVDLVLGWWRSGPGLRRIIRSAGRGGDCGA